MKEVGIVNSKIARVISEQGHRDLLMVVDAGFAIPKHIKVIDISLSENNPMVVDVLAESYGTSDHELITEYIKIHGRFYSDYNSWIDYLRTRSFCVGTRIHGTIASIIAGTPALLVAHDSRTQELAKAMGIPYLLSSEIDTEKSLDPGRLIDSFFAKKVSLDYFRYRDRFKSFFADNQISISF